MNDKTPTEMSPLKMLYEILKVSAAVWIITWITIFVITFIYISITRLVI